MAADNQSMYSHAADEMDAEDSMSIDYSIDLDSLPPVAKRQKLSHYLLSRKRKQLEIPRPDFEMKRVKIQPPKRDRLGDSPTKSSKRRKFQTDRDFHEREHLSRTKNPSRSDKMHSQLEVEVETGQYDDLSTAELGRDPLIGGVLERQEQEKKQLKQRVEDRLLKHRTNERAKERMAELKAQLQSRIQEEIRQRAEGKTIAEMLTEFCGIRCSDRSHRSLKKAYKRALTMLHPDKVFHKPLEEMIEAEEIYKLLQPIYCEL